MRASLEALHAELTATRAAEGEIASAQFRHIRQLADEAERATNSGDTRAAVISNRAFTRQSMRSPGARSRDGCRSAVGSILVATERSLTRERRDAVNREHRKLVEALAAGDAQPRRSSRGAMLGPRGRR
jgi:DNA-binding GntR family transcriptional regulator